ncbi:MAG: flagellar type III secretion system pore protein FliP [Roseburia sp.]|uniref:flagellar type III secretion system pore protein FliP n=1 Tax=Roseburia sp. 831b TaxID=1261635 RepID=UPI0009519BC3|nr:flagellar type III secretion system pore protein FliP [Roseburia sp. 831b]MCI5918564.1 flagellar type III secretion system pore protein FliP [Roseburia sp.]MDY5883237.1 flagellar type III secretion system pore protein FliP [Roseburia sp.]WVK74370.1 flagellar type III secretion system pore protein FliP [Roseburia sp. 831b]
MSKWKKTYCMLSFCFAIFVFTFATFTVCDLTTVYATSATDGTQDANVGDTTQDDTFNPDSISQLDDTDTKDTSTSNQNVDGLSISYNNDSGSVSSPIKIILFLTVISLAPSILIMMTSFTRIIVVLHFVRAALGTQTTPPNQILVGLALFLTFFIMWPTFTQINETAIQPLDAGEITMEQALEIGQKPIREFMYGQTQTKDLELFVDISGETYDSYDDVPMTTLIPAFIISELRAAFIIGFLIYIPFIVIDMVVASVLMSMGMMMLPPTTISLPFKILLFILADGWDLVIGGVVKTFY